MKVIHNKPDVVLGAPPNWDDRSMGPCEGLPVRKAHNCFYSYWKPSIGEFLKMLFGVPIRLIVASERHPPVAIDVERN